ncbi:glycosyltransferase family 4 protein [Flavobacterium ardleyense]|uniref:glycosyltransferase family 4 protein n=1 Tax=Flavobacterium ardleyense TaxID=2038737 RepID=UPI00298CEEBB|nr:glycosyltransferase [Flavobacterium ardleyense]
MKLLIITHVIHGKEKSYFGYSPYIREMNIWTKFAQQVVVVAPFQALVKSTIDLKYSHQNLICRRVESINFQTFTNSFRSLLKLPKIFYMICKEIESADHIHLRCPGNIGLLGCIAQIFFPSKKKSAKYAGNWDPKSKQPLSYKLQKWILSNTFLTKNMTVLVYGKWPNQTKNIKSFFTASYFDSDKLEIRTKSLQNEVQFLFVGSLSSGKRPLYAIKIVEELQRRGKTVSLDIYGEGEQRIILEQYIETRNIPHIRLHGNQEEHIIRDVYKSAHFLILPSKSEGWPKVVAEAMFWKCLPIASPVSCVPFMLNFGRRGILLEMQFEKDVAEILKILDQQDEYVMRVNDGMIWSRKFTLDLFKNEVHEIVKG